LRVAVVHGYFLADSGSAIYTRELARALTHMGHEVTLICQDQHPEVYDFIDSLYDLDPGNSEAATIYELPPRFAGRCRMVRPHLDGRLLTYVAGPFPPFEAIPFQDAPTEAIEDYARANIAAMSAIFKRWSQDLVQANHAVLQPYLVRQALQGAAQYVVTIHGSELNFTVRRDPRMAPYFALGLEKAAAVVTLSETSRQQTVELAVASSLNIDTRTVIVAPGVDTGLFVPGVDHAALADMCGGIDPDIDDLVVFAGRLLWTKGLQYVVAALPAMLELRPRLQLAIVGAGPMRESLGPFITALERGEGGEAAAIVERDPELRAVPDYGPVMTQAAMESVARSASGIDGGLSAHIHFTGHLPHERLAPLFAAADISLAPSVYPEAFGLVSIEALAAGAIPVATYQTGLRTPLDVVAGELQDEKLRMLEPGISLTEELAGLVVSILEEHPTRDPGFRVRLHALAARNFSWEIVARRYLAWGEA